MKQCLVSLSGVPCWYIYKHYLRLICINKSPQMYINVNVYPLTVKWRVFIFFSVAKKHQLKSMVSCSSYACSMNTFLFSYEGDMKPSCCVLPSVTSLRPSTHLLSCWIGAIPPKQHELHNLLVSLQIQEWIVLMDKYFIFLFAWGMSITMTAKTCLNTHSIQVTFHKPYTCTYYNRRRSRHIRIKTFNTVHSWLWCW